MNFDSKKVMYRYFIVAALLVAAFIAVMVKAVLIMTVEKDYWLAVQKRYQRTNVELPATRGNILAADGQLLAASIPEYRIYMDFMSWEEDSARRAKDQHRRDSLLFNNMDSICNGMHAIFPDIDPKKFEQLLREGRKKKSHHWKLYKRRISYIEYKQVKQLPLFNLGKYRGGFHEDEFKTRKNPYGKLAARTIGDLYGEKDSARCGLELGMDSVLRGKPGIARRQKVLSRYLTIIETPPEDGRDIQTTLDVGMQDICEIALNEKLKEIEANAGVCILMEVATGDVKAITSLTKRGNGVYEEINPIALNNMMEPGSVFKPMSFLVAFDDGLITMNDEVNTGCGIVPMHGRRMRDHNWHRGGYGTINVPQIIGYSSNIGVSTLIDRHYGSNPQRFVDGIYRTGIAEDLKIPIPGYAKPNIPRPVDRGERWAKTDLPWMSIGYVTQIPPISTVTFYNGIANNGRMMRPRFVKAELKDGQMVREYPPVAVRERMASPEAVSNVQECLKYVVEKGVGKKAGSKQFGVAGKTGTAQVWTKHGFSKEYLVSFVGYFPSERPLYTCIVCIRKHGNASGGGHCGPVFRRVAESVMALRNNSDYSGAHDTLHSKLPLAKAGNLNALQDVLENLDLNYIANYDMSEPILWGFAETGNELQLKAAMETNDVVPDVRGYGLRDALYRLEKLGLRVNVEGAGRVTSQSPAPGKPFQAGETINLKLTRGNTAPKQEPRREIPTQMVPTPDDSLKTQQGDSLPN